MIATDQPTIFGDDVRVALSSKDDGNMKFGIEDDAVTRHNREKFLASVGVDIAHTSLVGITYETDDFTKYRIVTTDDKSVGMREPNMTNYADALVTRDAHHALFLPLADCAGVVIYDPRQKVLMVSHLGRHSVEQNGAVKSIEYLQKTCGSRPTNLLIWISPSVGKATYPLRVFAGKSLQEIIVEQLQQAGAVANHIEVSHIDTAHDENYFSHSQFLKGNDESGRFAIVAEIKASEKGDAR